jgi:hypothetical protein
MLAVTGTCGVQITAGARRTASCSTCSVSAREWSPAQSRTSYVPGPFDPQVGSAATGRRCRRSRRTPCGSPGRRRTRSEAAQSQAEQPGHPAGRRPRQPRRVSFGPSSLFWKTCTSPGSACCGSGFAASTGFAAGCFSSATMRTPIRSRSRDGLRLSSSSDRLHERRVGMRWKRRRLRLARRRGRCVLAHMAKSTPRR